MEDWCAENLPQSNWRLDYSPPICVYGVDIPSKIIFKESCDLVAFKLRFNVL